MRGTRSTCFEEIALGCCAKRGELPAFLSADGLLRRGYFAVVSPNITDRIRPTLKYQKPS